MAKYIPGRNYIGSSEIATDLDVTGPATFADTVTISGDVGIGTTSPDAILHIKDVNPRIIKLQDANYTNQYATIGFDDGHLKFSSDPDNQRANSVVLFKIDNSEKMRLTSGGNLLLGTTTDSGAKLNVNGTILCNNEIQFTNSAMRIYRSSDDMRFRTNNTDKLTITSDGKLGVGTSSPNVPLEVNGNARFGNSSTGIAFGILSTDVYKISGADTGFTGWNSLHFVAAGNDGLFIEKDTNNVGIGTVSPTEKIHVVGDALITGDSHADAFKPAATGEPIKFKNFGSTELARITDGGNVLIGTTADGGGKLNIKGNLFFQQDSYSDNTTIGFGNPARYGDAAFITYDGNGDFRGSILFGTVTTASNVAASEVMRISKSGNLLIGTTTDNGSKLQIRASSTSHQILSINRANSDIAALYLGNDSNNKAIIASNNADLRFGRDFNGTFSEYLKIENGTGNVLLAGSLTGTTATLSSLILSGASDQILSLNSSDDGPIYMSFFRAWDRHAYFGFGSSSDTFSIVNEESSGAIAFSTASTERARITSGGNLLIGTTTDDGSSKLQVNGDVKITDNNKAKFGTSGDLQIYHNATDSAIENATGDLYIVNGADGKDIIFKSDDGAGGATDYIRLDGSQTTINVYKNLLVGTTVDSGLYKIDVAGKARVQSVLELDDVLTLNAISTPADPASGKSSIYMDSADGAIKVKINVGGTVVTRTIASYE